MQLQTLLEHFAAERARLQAELSYVANQGAKADAEMFNLLLNSYKIDARTTPVTLDLDGGFIITPDPEPAEEKQPAEPVKLRAKAQEG